MPQKKKIAARPPADAAPPAEGKKRKLSAEPDAPVAVAESQAKGKKKRRAAEGSAAAPDASASSGEALAPASAGEAAEAASSAAAVSPEAQALIEQAVQEVYKGITTPGMQKGMKAFIPMNWSTKYKAVLGPYKQFLMKHPDKFKVVMQDACNFTVHKPGEVSDSTDPAASDAAAATKGTWQKLLLKAWLGYCYAIPKPSRQFSDFMAAVPTGIDVEAALKDRAAAAASKGKGGAAKKKAKGTVLGRMVSADGAAERDVRASKATEATDAAQAPAAAGKKKLKKKRAGAAEG